MRWMSALDACAIHEDRNVVAVSKDTGGEAGHFGLRGQVGGVDCCGAAEGLDCFLGGVVGGVALRKGREDESVKFCTGVRERIFSARSGRGRFVRVGKGGRERDGECEE